MTDFVTNIVGEKDFYPYKPSTFNPWDESSLRTKLEIWAHRNKINSLDQVSNLLVHYFFGALLMMPHTNAYLEFGMADMFYKKTASSIKVLTFDTDSASLPQVKAFVIQTGVQQSADDFEFLPCEIKWMYNYIRTLGVKTMSSRHFLKSFKLYYLLEFSRPKNGTEYEIFTSNGMRRVFESNQRSPLRVSVQKKNVELQNVDVQMNDDAEKCRFNILQPFPEQNFDAQVSRFVEDEKAALDLIRSIFEFLSDWYIHYRTIFKMPANADSFLSFCHGALEHHIAQNFDLELFRMRQDYSHEDALYLKSSKHFVTNENSHPVVKCVVSDDRKNAPTPHFRMHAQEIESNLPMLTSKHTTVRVIVKLTHLIGPFDLGQPMIPNYNTFSAFSVQKINIESAPRKNFIVKMIELSRIIHSVNKDTKKYVASEIENLKVLTQIDRTNHSISFHLLGQLLGIQGKDNKSLLKTFFEHKNHALNQFIKTFTIRESGSSTIVVINILENDNRRAKLSSIFQKVGSSRPMVEDEKIENFLIINIRSSVNLFPLPSFDKQYLLLKKRGKFQDIIVGQHEELPHYGADKLLSVLHKAQEGILFVEKMQLFRNLKPPIKSSSDFSSIIQGVLSSQLDFDMGKIDGRVVFKFIAQSRINHSVLLAPEWDIIDNVNHFGKCAMNAIRTILQQLSEFHKDDNVTVISMVHQHLVDDRDTNIVQIAKISNWKESTRRVLDWCSPKYGQRQKRAISDCLYVRYSRADDMIALQELGPVSGSVKSLNSQQMTSGFNEMGESQPGPSGLQKQQSLTSIDGAESQAGRPVSENVRQRMKSTYNRIIQKSVSQMTLVSTSPTTSNFLRFFPQDMTTARKRAFQVYSDRMIKTMNAYMYSRMASNIVAGFINKDYAMVGINLGLLSTAALPYFTRSLLKKGETLLGAGRLFAGVSRVGTAIVAPRVGVMGLVIYSLVDSAGQYKSGNEDALVSVIGDSLILSFELTSIGLQIASKLFLQLRFAASAVNPVVAIVTTIIFIGVDIYLAVRAVDQMNEIIPLSSTEEVDLGIMSFFHVDSGLENLRRSKIHNINAAINVMDIFQQSNGSVKYMFRPRTYTKNRDETVFHKDNSLDLRTKSTIISRVWPNPIAGLQVVAMDDEYTHLNNDQGEKRSVFSCSYMIGFKNDDAHPNATQVIVHLGDGHDMIYGFKDADHIFIMGDGNKYVQGSNGTDNFVLSGDQWTVGILHGVGGLNMVNMTLYATDKDIRINVTENYGYISNIHEKNPNAQNSLLISNIQEFIGREKAADKINCSCDTKTLYLKGGRSDENMDEIFFGHSCNYSTKMILTPPVIVDNSISTRGVFHYIVEDKVGLSEILLPKQNTTTEHDFLFNIEILDLMDMNIDRSNGGNDVIMSVEADHDKTGPKMFYLVIKNINHKLMFLFNDFALMTIVGDTGYVNQTTHKTVDNILAHYPEAADRLGLSMRIHSLESRAVVIMGHSKIDTKSETHNNLALVNTLKNDPTVTSHLVGCTMRSIYMLMCIQDNPDDIPRTAPVIIHNYYLTPNSNSTLFTSGFDQAVAEIAKTRPTFKLEVSGNDLSINVTVKEDNKNKYLTQIVIKDALIKENYKKLIIARRRLIFIVKNDEGFFQLVPKPLEYDGTSIMVTEYQIEPYMNIIVKHPIGAYTFLKSGGNLIISNTLDTNSHDHVYIMLTLIGFYRNQDMLTLTINFKDRDLVLANHSDAINSAAYFHSTFMDSSNNHTDYGAPDYDETEEYTG